MATAITPISVNHLDVISIVEDNTRTHFPVNKHTITRELPGVSRITVGLE